MTPEGPVSFYEIELLEQWNAVWLCGMDVLVVGGGAAGVQAALVLGRARRSVTVLDAGEPRNAGAAAVHNLAGHEGISPGMWLARARDDAERYGVRFVAGTAAEAVPDASGWRINALRAHALVLATGVREVLPEVAGLSDLWGGDVVSCPYCHGWEARGRRLAVVGTGPRAWQQLLLLRRFTDDLVLASNGPADLDERRLQYLEDEKIGVRETPIERVAGRQGRLEGIFFADGSRLERDVLFAATSRRQASTLPAALGARIEDNAVVTDANGYTGVADVWAAGSCARPSLTVAGAIGHATTTAIALNNALIEQDVEARLRD